MDNVTPITQANQRRAKLLLAELILGLVARPKGLQLETEIWNKIWQFDNE